MARDRIRAATTAKRQLLNTSQRKYLGDRINHHRWKLKREWPDDDEDEQEPPKVVAARKVIEDWRNKVKAKEKDREKKLDAHVEKLIEALLFESAETALAKVAEFEDLSWRQFEEMTPTRRRGPIDFDDRV